MAVKLSKVIAPSFAAVHPGYQRAWAHPLLAQGRARLHQVVLYQRGDCAGHDAGCGKGLHTNAVVLRRYGVTLRESVFEQIGWAVNALGVSQLWRDSVSPMSYTYLPTGQKILFRGWMTQPKPSPSSSPKAGPNTCGMRSA